MDYMHQGADKGANSYLISKHYPSHNTKNFPNHYSSLRMRSEYLVSETKPIFSEAAIASQSNSSNISAEKYLTSTPNLVETENTRSGISVRTKENARMRIFLAVLLRSWRNRRCQVVQLQQKFDEVKKANIDVRNHMYVLNTLYRVEQRRNHDVTCQLKRALEGIAERKCTCEGLTSTILNLKADKTLLEKELLKQSKECEKVNGLYSKAKSDLCRLSAEKCHLVSNTRKEQLSIEVVEKQKNKLFQELIELRNDHRKSEEKLRRDISFRDDELRRANTKINTLEVELKNFREKSALQVVNSRDHDCRMKEDLQVLQEQVSQLQCYQQDTISHRLTACWDQIMHMPKSTLQKMHLLAYYMLPAMPPPAKFEVKVNRYLM